MAVGKRCDVCGRFYKENNNKGIYGKTFVGAGLVTSKGIFEHKDLCDDCIADLVAFFNGEGYHTDEEYRALESLVEPQKGV